MQESESSLPDLTLGQLQEMMRNNGVTLLLVKELAANDNTKNQLYLGGSMEAANILPIGEVRVEVTEKENQSLKAPLPFNWLQPDGSAIPAPGAQIILYPQYPEVRMSGFLKGAVNAPSMLLNVRMEGRLLFLGITTDRRIIAWVASATSALAHAYRALKDLARQGVFFVVPLAHGETDPRHQLLSELKRIHLLDWIDSRAMRADGSFVSCTSSHCVGYTLEAEFKIPQNGKAEPDYKGWEIKAGIGLVRKSSKIATKKPVTLMTPEPTGGFYRSAGVAAFVRKFGYPDKNGVPDRLNFGGNYRVGSRHSGTKLTLTVNGFDSATGLVTNPSGSLALVSDHGEVAVEWTFAALMGLWNRKHAQAVYVPAEMRKDPARQYRYGATVRLGEGTDFNRFMAAIACGSVFYDPGIKLEKVSTKKPFLKRRSQFRVPSVGVDSLYARIEQVDVLHV